MRPTRLFASCLLLSSVAMAQDAVASAALVDVTLEPSRPHTAADPRQSMVGTIRNKSGGPLRFSPRETVFRLTPQADGSGHSRRGCAEFALVDGEGFVTLPPGESTQILWDLRANQCNGEKPTDDSWCLFSKIDGFCGDFVRSGQYKVLLDINFTAFQGAPQRSDPAAKKDAEEKKTSSETESKTALPSAPQQKSEPAANREPEEKSVPVGKETKHSLALAQTVTLGSPFGFMILWSVVGGLAAYWVKAFLDLDPTRSEDGLWGTTLAFIRDWKSVIAFLGNGALSGILVVLGTQFEGTAFPIKVNASSVIGAFTSGFILNFAGQRVIAWLKGLGGPAPNPSTPPPPKP